MKGRIFSPNKIDFSITAIVFAVILNVGQVHAVQFHNVTAAIFEGEIPKIDVPPPPQTAGPPAPAPVPEPNDNKPDPRCEELTPAQRAETPGCN